MGRPRVSTEIIRIGQEVLLGLNFPRNIVPYIVGPPFKDTSPSRKVKTVTRGVL